MYQSIVTRYLAPTNRRGARISAFAEAGRITFDWSHNIGQTENHQRAAIRFASWKGWRGRYHGAPHPDKRSRDYIWVCESPSESDHFQIKPLASED